MILIIFVSRLWTLQVMKGEIFSNFKTISRRNSYLCQSGIIYDRNKVELASNGIKDDKADFASRIYAFTGGLSHVVGYLKYPIKDSAGYYYEENYRGQAGVENL